MLSAISVQICDWNNVNLCEIVHPASQDGKNMVETHFEIENSHIIRYFDEKQLDVTVNGEVVEELIYDGGLPNMENGYIYIYRNGNLKQWIGQNMTAME